MFRMKIENIIKINDNISFGGSCENRNNYTGKLIDDSGNIYETYIPLGVDLIFDDSNITLCMKGEYDTESLKGRVLRSQEA